MDRPQKSANKNILTFFDLGVTVWACV